MAAGSRVVGAAASEFEDDLPYGIWTEALDPYLRDLGDRAISRLGFEDPGALAALLPALGEPVAVDRHRVHRALRDLLERLAGPRPLVLWLDDLHWADPGSVDALAALVRRPPGGAVLLALAARERRWPPALTTALAAAAREDRVTRLALAPLSEAEAAELVGRDVAAIYQRKRRQPVLPRAARPLGGSQLEGGHIPFSAEAGQTPLGARARGRSRSRSRQSSRSLRPRRGSCSTPRPWSATRSILRSRPRSPSCPRRTRSARSTTCWSARSSARPDAARRFAFRHPVVRHAVYEGAPGGWRLGAHTRAAAALERRGAGSRGAGAPRRARGAARRRAGARDARDRRA